LPRRSRRGRSVADLNRAKTELRPGTLLTSECDGHLQRVMELPDGFTWNGKTDRSLSKVAFAITGSHWNGPRFFSLREAVVGGSAVKNAATTGGFRKPIYSDPLPQSGLRRMSIRNDMPYQDQAQKPAGPAEPSRA